MPSFWIRNNADYSDIASDYKRMRTVLDLKIGEEGTIKDFKEENVACKLLTIGIVPHTNISLIRKAPFGGALCFKLGETFIALRTQEAKAIIIE